jgi:hypothetical protein
MWNSPDNQLGILAVNQLCHIFHLLKWLVSNSGIILFWGIGCTDRNQTERGLHRDFANREELGGTMGLAAIL